MAWQAMWLVGTFINNLRYADDENIAHRMIVEVLREDKSSLCKNDKQAKLCGHIIRRGLEYGTLACI